MLPDIVFFMVDQLSAKWFEAALAGASNVPNFRRLTDFGTRFPNTITSNPVCCPTRATIATGLTSVNHGVLENGYQLDPALPTFMRALQDLGYRTGALGKVHLKPHFAGVYPDYRAYGFDVTHITEDVRGGEWLDWVEREQPEQLDTVMGTIWAAGAPDFAAYGPDRRDLRERLIKARQEASFATLAFPKGNHHHHVLPFPEELSQTCWITGHGLDFIRRTPADQPLFAHISYVQPHSPFTPPARCLDAIEPARIPEPVPPTWVDDPHRPRLFRDNPPTAMPDPDFARECYFADLAHLDEQLGQVLAAVEARGRLEQTYILFVSDHGELLGDHGAWGKEGRHYDACLRVPLVIAGPGLRRGQVREEFVQLEDLCPTILDMAGTSLPPLPSMGPYFKPEPGELSACWGRSLLPLCHGDTTVDWRTAAYSATYNKIDSNRLDYWCRSVRTREWRYTWYPAGGGEQLIDLVNDPDELVNLAHDPDYAATRQALRDRLLELIVGQEHPKTPRDLFAIGVH